MVLTILPEIENSLFQLQTDEFSRLEASILAEGIREPIIVWPCEKGNVLIDGHNRYKIAQKHNIPFEVKEKHFNNIEEALEWIDNNQLGRRNLTDEQRAYVLGRMYNRQKLNIGRPSNDKKGEKFTPFIGSHATAKTIAESAGVSERSVRNAAAFAQAVDKVKEVAPEAADKILKGEVKDAMTALPKVEKEKLPEIAEKIAAGEAKKVIDAKRIVKAEEIKQTEELSGKYRVIYADPPWQYGDKLIEGYGAAENHYPTMSLSDICEMPIKDIAEDNAVLFLWATSPMLEDSFKVINAWGFKYKASFVWDKVKHNMGHYNSVRHELLLIATRGSCLPDTPKLLDSVVEIERSDVHSEKPEQFREIIDMLYPYGKRIELFARKKVDNWDVWGNQINDGLLSKEA